MRRHLFVIALLLLVTSGVFCRVLQADFVAWDDERTVPENTSIQGLDARRLGWMFTNVSFALRYKPLCWLSYALIHAGAGLNPFGLSPGQPGVSLPECGVGLFRDPQAAARCACAAAGHRKLAWR